MWIWGEKDQFTLLKNTMNRGKMNQKNEKKDTGHYLEQNGHETQTTKQILCTIIDEKGETRFRKQIFFNTDTYKARRHFSGLFFFL